MSAATDPAPAAGSLLDTHVHLWNRSTDPQPWIDPETMAVLDRDFEPGHLASMLDATGMAAAVVVQSSNSAAETRRLLAHRSPRIAGVVGWLDLSADPIAQLDQLDPAARRRLVGLRHLIHLDPDPRWLARPAVQAGLARLAPHDVGFDLVVRWWQLPSALTTAKAHPGLRLVLDHLGGTADADDFDGWAQSLRDLARLPNVWAKLSGLAGMGGPRPATAATVRRAVDVAMEAFGPGRLMYGSDWPVAELGAGALAWRAAVEDLIDGLSEAEREAVLSRTGADFYRVQV
ncbi:amidohydrolase [Actinoplanes cyaneus]|uniref:Amidohydrolase n=1 Tax=Actinoplanes cyaneus TaxID=52696 RepID=A0A919IUU2_9ACTN|nr:amidohydrolase family protein [Actinoplanes cyaneus]MCW2140748.1 L-fuconolactonase [Actinoplanes cyaneus]GID70093.1 amidohydrolase [Actinoplanes cyaneus]